MPYNKLQEVWREYNKLDRKKSTKGFQFMKRAVCDKQFKLAAVRLTGAGASSVAVNKSIERRQKKPS
jgi:hypothetical protein